MTNPMTAEEALRQALEPWPMAALDATRIISRLEPIGYALHPIKIDEAAVQHAMEAYNIYPSMDHELSMKAAITAYHVALTRKEPPK